MHFCTVRATAGHSQQNILMAPISTSEHFQGMSLCPWITFPHSYPQPLRRRSGELGRLRSYLLAIPSCGRSPVPASHATTSSMPSVRQWQQNPMPEVGYAALIRNFRCSVCVSRETMRATSPFAIGACAAIRCWTNWTQLPAARYPAWLSTTISTSRIHRRVPFG